MDLLMPIIGCALGIVASIMSIKVVLDKGKKAITGAVANKAEQVLQSPAVQTALTAGMAVATGGASLGASAAASAATNGIRMASNVASTAASAQNSTAGANGKNNKVRTALTGVESAGRATAGVAGVVTAPFSLTTGAATKLTGKITKLAGRQINGYVKNLGEKRYKSKYSDEDAKEDANIAKQEVTLKSNRKSNSARIMDAAKTKRLAVSDRNALSKRKQELEEQQKNWKNSVLYTGKPDYKLEGDLKKVNAQLKEADEKVASADSALRTELAKKDVLMKQQANLDGYKKRTIDQRNVRHDEYMKRYQSKTGRALEKVGSGLDRVGTVEMGLGLAGARQIGKAITGKNLFIDKLYAPKGTMQEMSETGVAATTAVTSAIATSTTPDGANVATTNAQTIAIPATAPAVSSSTATVVAPNAQTVEMPNAQTVAIPANGNNSANGVAAIGARTGTVNGESVAIPMQGDYRVGYNPELAEMGIPPMAQLVYNDFSVLQSSRFDRNGTLMSQQAMANPRDTMNQYSSSNNNGNFSLNVSNISTVNGIGTTQHYEEAMKAMNEHFQERFGTIAYSEEEGRAMAQMLDRLQTQREVTTSNSIMNDVIYKEQPEQQKIDAITAEFQGNADAVKARQNYIESHTEAIVTQQTEGRSFSEDDMQKIREQAQKVVEQSTENRIINEEGFRNDIFGEEISSRLNTTFSQIDSDLERKINDAIAEKRESLNATYASSHPDIPYKEIDSARITEDMQRDLEQMVTAQVSARSVQMESQVQSNVMESMQYNYGNTSNLERQRLGTQTETQTSTRTGLQEDTYYTNDTRPQATGNTYNQSNRRYSGSGRVNGGSARVSRRVNRGRTGENSGEPQVTNNLRASEINRNNKVQ